MSSCKLFGWLKQSLLWNQDRSFPPS
jgi:hypothetical protein